jgi:manganese/zinc/iron transport system permease protein
VLVLNLLLVLGLYKELKLSTFDRELSAALGFAPLAIHYLLMSAVSVTVVGSFESVGAILVVAMLVVPPAAAYLLTDRLSRMLLLAVLLGVLSALGGYGLARTLDASIAGAMALVAGLLFLLSFLLSPRHGLVSRLLNRRRLRERLSGQLLLLHLRDKESRLPAERLARRFGWSEAELAKIAGRLAGAGYLERNAEGLCLTPAGARSLAESGLEAIRHTD